MDLDLDINSDIDSDGDSDMTNNTDGVPETDVDMVATDSNTVPVEDTNMAVTDINAASAEDGDMTAAGINVAPVTDTDMVVTNNNTVPILDMEMAGSRTQPVSRRELTLLTSRRRTGRSCRSLSPTRSLRQGPGDIKTIERERELLFKHALAFRPRLVRLKDRIKSVAEIGPSPSRMRLLVCTLLHDIEYAEADKHHMERIAERKISAALEWHVRERARISASLRRRRSAEQRIRAAERRYSSRLRELVGEEDMKNMTSHLLEDVCNYDVPKRTLEDVFHTRLSRLVRDKMDECGIEDYLEGLNLRSD